jgi:hypothetical protein
MIGLRIGRIIFAPTQANFYICRCLSGAAAEAASALGGEAKPSVGATFHEMLYRGRQVKERIAFALNLI